MPPPACSGLLVIWGCEGVGDALVGGAGLAVDAVGVDLEQDGDAVPGAAGDFGGRDPGVQPQGHGGVAQVVGAAGEGGGVLRGGERGGAGGLPDGAVGALLDGAVAGGAEEPPVGAGAGPLGGGAQERDGVGGE